MILQNNTIEKYWAKDTGEGLLRHSENVQNIAQQICKILPFNDLEAQQISKSLPEIALLHDVGKAAIGFQKMLKEKIGWPHRHEILSVAIASQIANHLSAEELFAIITHHRSILPLVEGSTYEKCLPDNELPILLPNIFFDLFSEIESDNFVNFLKQLCVLSDFEWKTNNLDFKVEDFGILKYWWLLRGGKNGQLKKTTSQQRKRASLLRGLLVTSDHLASANYKSIPDIPIIYDYVNKILDKELKGKSILPFQKRCGQISDSAILKAPTGSGKTLGMLLWAANNQFTNGRLFYTLPYTASINAMHQRLSGIFDNNIVGVLHHRNTAYLFRLLEEDHSINAVKEAKNLSSLAREMYYPVKVLTPHQILKVVLRGKGWELGLVEFQNACFIFDEIHAFEPLIVGLVIATAKWLQKMGAKILFASATLPDFLEKILKEELNIKRHNIIEPNPESEEDNVILEKKRHQIIIKEGNIIENLQIIIEDILRNTTKTVLIVCNYVATSQEVCNRLDEENKKLVKEKKQKIEYCLLHARFNSNDRFRIEKDITSDIPPRVLVATQAVEVSLDIDYDSGYIEPAPIDALAQRFGRINRKGERLPALVTVFTEQSVENSNIYDKQLVVDTINLLKKRENRSLSEQDLVYILNEVYKNGYKEGSPEYDRYKQGLENSEINEFEERLIAGTYSDWIENIIEKTDEQVEVLPYNCLNEKGEQDCLYLKYKQYIKNKEYIKAKMLLVPVRIIQFHIAKKKGAIKWYQDIKEWVTTLEYSSQKGLDLMKQESCIL